MAQRPLTARPPCLYAERAFARLKSVTLKEAAAEPLVGFRRKDYPEYYRIT
jgi:hypothetical protein